MIKTYLHFKTFLIVLSGILTLETSCKKENNILPENTFSGEKATAKKYDASVPLSWYNLQLKLIKESPGWTPPIAARAVGYTGVALYESIVKGMPSHHSLSGQLTGLSTLPSIENGKKYNWAIASNAALARIIKDLFGNASTANISRIDSLENANFDLNMSGWSAADLQRSISYGQSVGDVIYNWSLTDGGDQAYLRNFPASYIPPVGPGKWVPTGTTGALLPYWGSNRPFISANITNVIPPPPPAYSEAPGSVFYNEAMTVYTTTNNLTTDQRNIALFWADNPGATPTPPGHSIALTAQILAEQNASLDDAAITFAKMGIGQADAFICCWKCKYDYSILRPITYIRNVIDPSWTPLIGTPSFPEYTSGHSTQSGAMSEILSSTFGAHYSFTDHTHDAIGFAPRSFNSFEQAALEAANSRLYGGIHYPNSNMVGLNGGHKIGRNVLALNW